MKILVVDDEQLLVKGMKFNLENEGYTVETAYDGATAIDMAKSGGFDLIILAMVAVIVGVTAAVGILMATVGIPFTSFMYGVDFEQFRFLCYLMVIAGGVIAAIDFLYAIVTVLRRQGSVMRLYLLAFVAVTALSLVLVNLIGLTGAVVSYLASMTFLLVLLVLEYLNIRRAIRKERNPFSS